MKKKLILAVITASMIFGSTAYAKTSYSDWAQAYVSEAEKLGIIPVRLSDDDLTKDITREQFCELAYMTIKYLTSQNEIKISYTARETHFYDTDNEAVTALKRLGIIAGRTSTKFDPDAPLLREEAASILVRMSDCLGLTRFTNSGVFSDRKEISSYAKADVDTVCGMKIMSGMSDGTFNPKGTYTKEQSISTMIRLIDNVPDSSSTEKIDNKRYYKTNAYYRWVEDEKGNVVFKLSAEKYTGLNFYSDGSKILAFAAHSTGTDVYDTDSGRKLFELPAVVIGTNSDKYIIVADAEQTLYGVYDFKGNSIVPVEKDWSWLYSEKYVTTPERV